MSRVERRERACYFAPTRRRHYFTLKAAIGAEALALIKKKYPTERADHDALGRMEYSGFHCSELPRFAVMRRRLERLVRRAYAEGQHA